MLHNKIPSHIEVEIGTFCNRSCSWCPNKYSERGQKKEFISEVLWLKILDELKAIDYKGDFCFHNYNEPLVDPTILTKLNQAKSRIPKAKLIIYSNGDYLTLDLLKSLNIAGLTNLIITLYPSDSSVNKTKTIEEFCSQLNLENHTQLIRSKKVKEIKSVYRNIQILVRYPDISSFNNRGESVELKSLYSKNVRTKPCYSSHFSASIDYLGNLKMCCNVYDSNSSKNEPYIIGNLQDQSLYSLWNSEKLELIRNQLFSADFSKLPICRSCKRTELDNSLADDSSSDEVISMIRVLRKSKALKDW